MRKLLSLALRAEIAVRSGLLTPRQVADALASDPSTLRTPLEQTEREFRRIMHQHRRDPAAALESLGGIDPAIHIRLIEIDPTLSARLAAQGAPARNVPASFTDERYDGFQVVGVGGMGVVYSAFDRTLNRRIALKTLRIGPKHAQPDHPGTLRPDSTTRSSRWSTKRRRFLREARITAGLQHAGVPPVHELGALHDELPYYTMRLVPGGETFAHRIARLRKKPMAHRLRLIESFLKVCDTIAYAHSRGVLHRDIKPSNIAVGEFGEVIVLDWGLATHQVRTPRSDRQRALQSGHSVGTPGYMSPEAATGELENIDKRSDVFSLGVMLYELLTGRQPWPTRYGEYLKAMVDRVEAKRADQVAADVPPGLARICAGALRLDRAKRPASVDEFSDAIRTWQSQSALNREIVPLLESADALYQEARRLTGAPLARQLDRALIPCAQILKLDPNHAEATSLLNRIQRARAEDRVREKRRRVQQVAGRTAIGAFIVLLTVAGFSQIRRSARADAQILDDQLVALRARLHTASKQTLAANQVVESKERDIARIENRLQEIEAASRRAKQEHEVTRGTLDRVRRNLEIEKAIALSWWARDKRRSDPTSALEAARTAYETHASEVTRTALLRTFRAARVGPWRFGRKQVLADVKGSKAEVVWSANGSVLVSSPWKFAVLTREGKLIRRGDHSGRFLGGAWTGTRFRLATLKDRQVAWHDAGGEKIVEAPVPSAASLVFVSTDGGSWCVVEGTKVEVRAAQRSLANWVFLASPRIRYAAGGSHLLILAAGRGFVFDVKRETKIPLTTNRAQSRAWISHDGHRVVAVDRMGRPTAFGPNGSIDTGYSTIVRRLGKVESATFGADRSCIVGNRDSSTWFTADGKLLCSWEHKTQRSITISPCGQWVCQISGPDKGNRRAVVRTRDGTILQTHIGRFTSAAFSADSRDLVLLESRGVQTRALRLYDDSEATWEAALLVKPRAMTVADIDRLLRSPR